MSNKAENEQREFRRSQKRGLVPKLRFPAFRNAGGWYEKCLDDFATIVRGGSPRPIDEYITNDANGLNWLKIGDIDKESKFVTSTQEKVIPAALTKTRVVNPGDLILSNSMSFGRPYILEIQTCIHDGWIAVSEINNSLDRDYLYYLMMTSASQTYFSNNAAGSGVQNLNADIIKLLPVSYPNKNEQQKIADCLASLDELMTLEAQKLATLKTHKKGLMQQLFPAEGETLPKLRFPEFRDEREWEERRLGNACEKILDGTHFSPKSKSGPRLYLTSKNIQNGGIDLSNISYISEEEHREIYKRCPVKQDDVLLTKDGANTGNCALNNIDYEFSLLSSVAVLRGIPSLLDQRFLYQLVLADRTQKTIRESMSGQAITRITLEKIGNFVILITGIEEQQKIADCLASLDDLIAAQTQKLAALKIHKKGLMQQLFPALDEVAA